MPESIMDMGLNIGSLPQLVSQLAGKERVESRRGISVVTSENPQEGLDVARRLLYQIVDPKTALFLSGGSTPEPLYRNLAIEKELRPGAVAMVDERIGDINLSNEKMINGTGFISYLRENGISFYKIRGSSSDQLEETASNYNGTFQSLLGMFPRKVAILGIGEDGHIASIAPDREDFKDPVFSLPGSVFVGSFRDAKNMRDGGFGKRITLTPRALREMDVIICLVFGKNKEKALGRMFERVPINTVPAHFLTSSDMAKRVILITDQKI